MPMAELAIKWKAVKPEVSLGFQMAVKQGRHVPFSETLNIREEDIRADCPLNAPMTLRAFNKISPRQFNTSVSPLNPFEIPRYAPTTVGQFSKALLQQQGQMASQMTSSLSIPVIEEAILAETDVEDFIIDFGDELVQFVA